MTISYLVFGKMFLESNLIKSIYMGFWAILSFIQKSSRWLSVNFSILHQILRYYQSGFKKGLKLIYYRQNDFGATVKNIDCFLHKVTVFCLVNVFQKLLRVPVGQWKPAALDLDHHTVALFESMGNIR